MPYLAKIRGYRERAEELRTIAQDFSDSETQRLLTRLAADYERMAEHLERSAPNLPCDRT